MINHEAEKTIVLGLEHFIDKIGYQSNEYKKRGIPIKYLVNDVSGLSQEKAEKYNADIEILPVGRIAKIYTTIANFFSFKPKWCELYDTGRLTSVYAVIALIFRCRLILILRGQEFKRKGLRAFGLRMAIALSDHIISKEANLSHELEKYTVNKKKMTEISNCVPIPGKEAIVQQKDKDIDILFLNSVRKERHVDLLLYAVKNLVKQRENLKVVITGFSSLDNNRHEVDVVYEKRILKMIHELDLEDVVEVKGFVGNPFMYYKRSKVFVLPADVIFLNYSLLEAMSYEVAPVVCNGEGAEKIIFHDYNGKIVGFSADVLSKAIDELLSEKRYESYGAAARETVKRFHSMENWGDKMIYVRKRIIKK